MPALIVKDGPNAGQRYEVDDEVVVGREDAGVTIEDAEISRKHAVIRAAEEGLEIEDLGSLNGTYVNGNKIEGTTRLSGGDTVKVGTTTFEVVAAAVRSSATVAAPMPAASQPEAAAAPAAAPPPPAPPQPAPPPQTQHDAPAEPFGHYAAAKVGGKGKVSSRKLTPQLISFAAIIATAVVLVIYFAANPV